MSIEEDIATLEARVEGMRTWHKHLSEMAIFDPTGGVLHSSLVVRRDDVILEILNHLSLEIIKTSKGIEARPRKSE